MMDSDGKRVVNKSFPLEVEILRWGFLLTVTFLAFVSGSLVTLLVLSGVCRPCY